MRRRPLVRLVFAVALSAGPIRPLLARQTAVPLTIENIQTRNRGVFDAAPSPDGRWVAATAVGPDGPGIYLVPLAPGPAAKLWIKGAAGPAWFPDGRRIV